MSSFRDNYMETQHMDVPEERQAEDLHRGSQVYDPKTKLKSTSVSPRMYDRTMAVLAVIIAVIVALVAAVLIYKGVMLFIPKKK